jgi:hypothetical protein
VLSVCLPLAWQPAGAADPKPDGDKVPPAKKVTLSGSMTLSKALAELKKQTDIDVEDRTEGADVKIKLNLENVTFWEAIEAIAKEADARVAPYLSEKKVGLVEGPYKALPISYSGPFRVAVKRLTAIRDLDTDAHYYVATLEITWEPGIKPFFLDVPPRNLVVEDEKMRPLKVDQEGSGRLPINGRSAELNIRLASIPRTTAKIAALKGTLHLIGPTKWLTFAFDNLGKIKADPKAGELTQDGVTARLSKLTFAKDRWDFEVSLDYPNEGVKLESFEIGDFVVYNEFALKKGDKLVEPNAGYETGGGGGAKATVTYKYDLEDKKVFTAGEKPEEWSVIYKTPGPMKEIPIKFEFKDLLLP